MDHYDLMDQPCRTGSPPMHARAAGWSAVLFGRNEARSIGRCIEALAVEARGQDLHVTVLLNGTTDDSAERAAQALRAHRLNGRIYAIEEGDKSNALNQFVHRLRPPAATYFFVDAYVAVAPGSLSRLDARLREAPLTLAAAAVPTEGRSAAALREEMLRDRGLHGSLFALRGSFLDRLAAKGYRLPLGLYRGDGMMGTFVMHDLDALGGGWHSERIAVEPGATWQVPSVRSWRWENLVRHIRRMMQQGRGRLQNRAIRDVIYRHGFDALPLDADELALRFVSAAPANRPRLWRDPFAALALARMRRPRPRRDITPRLITEVRTP